MSELPIGWSRVTLNDVATWSSGGTPSRSNPAFYEGSIPWFKTGELGPKVLNDSEEHISEAAIGASSAKVFPRSSVALAMYGATIGKVSILGNDAATNQACAVGMPTATDSEFLYYFLVSQEKAFADAGKGGAQPNISQGIVKSWPILLPSVAEQTRIVAKLEELLSDLDTGVAELKAAQKKLQQYRQSLLKAAVEGALTADWREAQRAQGTRAETGAQLLARILIERRARWEARQLAKFKEQGKAPPKEWQKKYPEPVRPETTDLPELPEGWLWATLDQLSQSVRNGVSKTPNADGVGYPILRINAVRPMSVNFDVFKHVDLSDTEAADYLVENGDLLVTRYNGSVDLLGVVGLVRGAPEEMLHPDKLIRIKPALDVTLPMWIELAANTGSSRSYIVRRVKTTAGQTGISGEDLKKMPIPLPSLAEQQHSLALTSERLEVQQDQEASLSITFKQSTAQRQNILRAAFAGRLVPQDPNEESASKLLERIRAERTAKQKVRKTRNYAET